jgi:hypothetical protein
MASEAGVLPIPPEERRAQGPPPARPHVPRGHRSRAASSRTRRSSSASPPKSLPPVAQRAPRQPQGPADAPKVPHAGPRDAPPAPDRLRLHHEDERILLTPMATDGVEAIGSMGNDTPLAVLSQQAAPCSTITSSSSSPRSRTRRSTDPRGDRHLDETRSAPRATSSSPQPTAAAASSSSPAPHQRGVREDPRTDPARPQDRRARDPLPRRARREGPREVDGRALHEARAMIEEEEEVQRPHPLRPRRDARNSRPSRRSSPWPACTTYLDPRRPAHARLASWSRPARRARCTTSRCSSATARARSIPTWPSRRSTA